MEHEELKKLIDLLKDTDIIEFQMERDGMKVRLKRQKTVSAFDIGALARQQPSAAAAPEARDVAVPSQPEDEDNHRLVTVTAPLVGTFYNSPSPDTPVFVEVGDRVKKGQVICIVEAMKLMNEIECEVDGKVVKCLVENAQPVEYGEPLFLVEPL